MPKKLIDIFPPKKFDETPIEEVMAKQTSLYGTREVSLKSKKLWLALPFFLAPLALIHFFFAEANIILRPQITELHIAEQIIAQVGQQGVDLGQKLIPARLFEQEKEATKSFGASGKEEREEKAGGTIRIFNENAASQTLVANSRFISENGELFRSTERVTAPAAQGGTPGIVDVQVVAAEAGSDYNIGPSNFSLPGLAGTELYTKVYGKSSVNMSGGAIGETSVVTANDIEAAKQQLLQELEVDAKATLLSRIPPNFIVLESAMETELLQDNTLVQEGAALEEFTYTASLQVSTLAFAKEDALLLVRHLFESYLQDIQVVKDNTFGATYTVEAVNISTGRMAVSADVSAQAYTALDSAGLEARLRGVSRKDIPNIISAFPSLETAEFSLWPFWLQHVPQDQSRVEVELAL